MTSGTCPLTTWRRQTFKQFIVLAGVGLSLFMAPSLNRTWAQSGFYEYPPNQPSSSAPSPNTGTGATLSGSSNVSTPAPVDSSSELNPERYEIRFGAFAHGVGSPEKGTVDVNPEIVFPRLPLGESNWWNVFLPRPHVGGLINLDGRTSSVYAGALWTFPLPARFFAELFLDGDKHDGYLTSAPAGHSDLGCPYLFHAGGSVGYNLSPQWSLMFTFDHQSNGRGVFGTECDGLSASQTPNQGINDYGLRFGYRF